MAKYDVFALKKGGSLVLDVQTDLLQVLKTRAVLPLMPEGKAPKPARHLNPVFEISGKEYVMVTQLVSTVSISELGPLKANLEPHFAEITAALDMLFQEF